MFRPKVEEEFHFSGYIFSFWYVPNFGPLFTVSITYLFIGFHFHVTKTWKSLTCVWLFATPWTGNFPGQNTGVGSLSLLQGLFPTQGSSSGLPHCRWILYQLTHQGSPWLPELLITLARVCLTVCTCMSPRQCACVGMCVYSKHNLEIRLALHIYSN